MATQERLPWQDGPVTKLPLARTTMRNGRPATEDPTVRQQMAQFYVELEMMRGEHGRHAAETDDAIDVGTGVEEWQQPLPEEPGDTRHRDDELIGHAP